MKGSKKMLSDQAKQTNKQTNKPGISNTLAGGIRGE